MHVVSFDFQSDVTSCGRHTRFFNVIDEYTCTALAIIPRRSFSAVDVVAVLEDIIAETGGLPTYVRSDIGPEYTVAALIDTVRSRIGEFRLTRIRRGDGLGQNQRSRRWKRAELRGSSGPWSAGRVDGVEVLSVTVGLPVSDLPRSVQWYRRVFELPEPDLEPVDGVVEFHVGSVWLQLGEDVTTRFGAEVVTRFGIESVGKEHGRLASWGVDVGMLEHVDGILDYFGFVDPDGNVLSFYSLQS